MDYPPIYFIWTDSDKTLDNLLRKTVYSYHVFTTNMHNVPMHLRCKATAWYLFICMHACNNFTNCMLFHENYDMQTIYLFIFPSSFLIRKNTACITLHIFTSKTAWYLILHACPYRHLSLKTCYFKQEHNTCKLEILSSFPK